VGTDPHEAAHALADLTGQSLPYPPPSQTGCECSGPMAHTGWYPNQGQPGDSPRQVVPARSTWIGQGYHHMRYGSRSGSEIRRCEMGPPPPGISTVRRLASCGLERCFVSSISSHGSLIRSYAGVMLWSCAEINAQQKALNFGRMKVTSENLPQSRQPEPTKKNKRRTRTDDDPGPLGQPPRLAGASRVRQPGAVASLPASTAVACAWVLASQPGGVRVASGSAGCCRPRAPFLQRVQRKHSSIRWTSGHPVPSSSPNGRAARATCPPCLGAARPGGPPRGRRARRSPHAARPAHAASPPSFARDPCRGGVFASKTTTCQRRPGNAAGGVFFCDGGGVPFMASLNVRQAANAAWAFARLGALRTGPPLPPATRPGRSAQCLIILRHGWGVPSP